MDKSENAVWHPHKNEDYSTYITGYMAWIAGFDYEIKMYMPHLGCFVLVINAMCTCISMLATDHKTKVRLARKVLLTSLTIAELSLKVYQNENYFSFE